MILIQVCKAGSFCQVLGRRLVEKRNKNQASLGSWDHGIVRPCTREAGLQIFHVIRKHAFTRANKDLITLLKTRLTH